MSCTKSTICSGIHPLYHPKLSDAGQVMKSCTSEDPTSWAVILNEFL
ncbi:hypothetical protein Goklo_020912 [Gossypium klotzschianum]|uniref:Uncharacterized protein n=1 Tax=Gossypium klotzschianum TaxID=34286 RepID=A0A7J8UTG9_9ROSI|nr:hypothetical protein [Gossypium klotzschianum]